MYWKIFYRLLISFFLFDQSHGHPTNYDQRQTGDLNVAVHLKDVQVIALVDGDLLDDYVDYNYVYDYADFTIRPVTKPTSTPSSTTTVKFWHTKPNISAHLDTKVPSSTTVSVSSSSTTTSTTSLPPPPLSSSSLPSSETTIAVNDEIPVTSTEAPTSSNGDLLAVDRNEQNTKPSIQRCPAGFALDAKGRCRKILRRRISFLPLTLKLSPKMNDDGTSKDLRVSSWMSNV